MNETKPIEVSPEAIAACQQRLAKRGTPDAFIRLGVRGKGCSGFTYVIEFADAPKVDGQIVWREGCVNFVVDKKSAAFLTGCRLSYKKTLMYEGFEFENPREASKCGCGASFASK